MVIKNIEMKDEIEILSNKTKKLLEKFENNYKRGNENIEFKEEFLIKTNQVEELFIKANDEQDLKIAAKLIVDFGKELLALENLFSVSSMFVLPEVHGICDDLIWSFEDRLALLKKNHLLNKRIKEVEKPTVKPNNNNNINNNNATCSATDSNKSNHNNANNNSNYNLTTSTTATVPFRIPTGTKYIEATNFKSTPYLHDKVYTLENLTGVALTLTKRVINSKRVLLTGLTNCNIKINSELESLQIFFCKYSQIFVGQVISSYIKNSYNSIISINGDKVRIDYCEGTIFKLPIQANVTVKECYNLEFATYENECDKRKELIVMTNQEKSPAQSKDEDVVSIEDNKHDEKQLNNNKFGYENIKGFCNNTVNPFTKTFQTQDSNKE